MRAPRSLALRLALAAGLWVAAGLGAAGWFITGVVVRQVEAAFDARLSGLLDAAVAAVTTDTHGHIVVGRAPAGADFDRALSGAYWQVTGPDGAVTTSRSLWDQTLPAAQSGHEGIAWRDIIGPRGEPLRLAERDLLLPDAAGEAHVAVALSRAETLAEIARLRTVLLAVFVLLGIGLVGGVVTTVVVGLAPLRRVRRALAEIRQGRRDTLDLDAPGEVAPLVAEVNALIATNRATVERARTHVGNLAHALKTPLAVLRNALEPSHPDLPSARAEAEALQGLVQHHLARARTAARATSVAAAAVSPLAVAQDIAPALRRLFADRGLLIEVTGASTARVRVDAQDLTEMLGNLMENACKWARGQVSLSVADVPGSVVITVADDGPGLPEQVREAALARGVRFDEGTAGAGLGLAIVADLATLYGGALDLARSDLGGLRATLSLPGVALPPVG
ncbi:sensor histidine kinase [Neoroseomonas lacus]|uniref:histidine kinase n=1 Tax=Neoroseomonas lacus TaxID=287609 RepID=A0A917KHY0_9PROT|nr:ATP-binding protein [Neoroseomonas lacus]GGJ12279.1 histidine kinase [Neoroseomonas lacus]